MTQSKVFRISLAASDVPAFLESCDSASWYAMDTGERVMTDEGPDAEAVLLVEPALHAATRPREALIA